MTARSWWIVIVVELAAAGLLLPRLGGPEPVGVAANGLVVALTDYGTEDAYAGILRGAILSANPAARVYDASHQVPDFDIASASYLLAEIADEWPEGTVFVVVIDPTVGSDRAMLAAQTYPGGRYFVAPDNGVLTDVLAASERVVVRRIENPSWRRAGDESATFDGRDWFGSVAGHLAAGRALTDVGPAATEVVRLRRRGPWQLNGLVSGTVLHVDHYGNLLTDIGVGLMRAAALQRGDRLVVRFDDGPEHELMWVRTYSDVGVGEALLTCDNGPRRAEIAVNRGSAAASMGVRGGARVRLRLAGLEAGQE